MFNQVKYLNSASVITEPRLAAFLSMIVITVFTALLYIPFLGNGTVFDDSNLFTSLSVYHYAQIPFDFRPRTLPYFTLGLTQVLFNSIEASRIVSLFLHIFCACMLFVLVRTLLNQAIKASNSNFINDQKTSSTTALSLLGTIWFAVNPVAVYGAGYLVQRTILFATLFSLLSLWYFRRAFAENRTGDVVTAALFYSLAVFSKEHAIMLPLAAVTLTTIYEGSFQSHLKRISLYLALCLPAAITVFFVAKSVVATSYEPDVGTLTPLIHGIPLLEHQFGQWMLSVLMQMGFFFDYIGYWVMPDVRSMSIDMRIDFAHLWGMWWFIPKALLYLLCPILSFFLLKRRGVTALFGCGLLYSWVLFFTELVTVRFQEPFVLYRSYLWAPGYVLMLVAVCRILLPIRWVLAGAIPVCIICFFLARERLSSFVDEGTVWKDAAAKLETESVIGSGRIFYNRGRQYLREKKLNEAIADFSQTISQNPVAYYAYFHRGTAYYALSDFEKAKKDLDLALKINPGYGPAQFARGQVFERIGCMDEATKAYSESLRLGFVLAALRLDVLKKEKVLGEQKHALKTKLCQS